MFLTSTRASIAQLVEQLICNQWVGSSSLSGGTIQLQRQLYLLGFDETQLECYLMSHTEPVLTADNYRIVREEYSASLKSRLMIGLMLVIMFLLISGWNSRLEPMVLHRQICQNLLFICTQYVLGGCSRWVINQRFSSAEVKQFKIKLKNQLFFIPSMF